MRYWLDGRLAEAEDVGFPLLSHSLHYGSAVFDGLRFYETAEGPAVFRLDEHLARFLRSASLLRLTLPQSLRELRQAVFQTILENSLRAGYVRPIAFLGEGDMELNATRASLHTAIAVWPWAPRLGQAAVRVKISSFLRSSPRSTVISAKFSGHYANSILARQEARAEGYHEALLLDHDGNIAEGPGANFFAVRDGTLLTPPADNIFAGLTRASLLELAEGLGIPVKVQSLSPRDIPSFDEAFFAGTAVEVVPIESIGDTRLREPAGNVTTRLRALYQDVVHGGCGKDRRWLSVVPACAAARS